MVRKTLVVITFLCILLAFKFVFYIYGDRSNPGLKEDDYTNIALNRLANRKFLNIDPGLSAAIEYKNEHPDCCLVEYYPKQWFHYYILNERWVMVQIKNLAPEAGGSRVQKFHEVIMDINDAGEIGDMFWE